MTLGTTVTPAHGIDDVGLARGRMQAVVPESKHARADIFNDAMLEARLEFKQHDVHDGHLFV